MAAVASEAVRHGQRAPGFANVARHARITWYPTQFLTWQVGEGSLEPTTTVLRNLCISKHTEYVEEVCTYPIADHLLYSTINNGTLVLLRTHC